MMSIFESKMKAKSTASQKARLLGACALLASILLVFQSIFDSITLASGARRKLTEPSVFESLQSVFSNPTLELAFTENGSTQWKTTANKKYPPEGQIPICFITSQFATSTSNTDKLFDVLEKAPRLTRSPFIQFIAFTNMENLRAPGWKVIVKNFGLKYRRIITQSRWPKFQAHHEPIVQQLCTVAFYIDGIVVPKDSVSRFQKEARRILQSNVQLSQVKHTKGRNISSEFHRILNASKDIPQNVEKSLTWLRAKPDYNSTIQMYANYQLGYAVASRAYDTVANFFWNHYSKEEDSWRDQPLWAYSLHHFDIVPLELPTKTLFLMDNTRKGMSGHTYSIVADNDAVKAVRYVQRQEDGEMNILCTSEARVLSFDSYKIRCEDFATWTTQCAPKVSITTGIAIEAVISDHTKFDFDATIIVKHVPKDSLTKGLPGELGEVYIDVVDNYRLHDYKINTDFTVILQNNLHEEAYPNHKHVVVKHWYNSYPADMGREDELPEYMPAISEEVPEILRLGSVWNTLESPTEGHCPRIDEIERVTYDCIEQKFDIEDWYVNVTKTPEAEEEVKAIMADPMLGRGRLYYNLFYRYDVMVALAKNNPAKLRYGNIQRIVSQMRSGVPVLVEIRGPVLQYFINTYNYKCVFQRVYPESGIWDFEEAVAHMKLPNVRRECQRHGLEIAKDYSPNRVGRKFLRAVGYEGEIDC
jgi:hypothetical protein